MPVLLFSPSRKQQKPQMFDLSWVVIKGWNDLESRRNSQQINLGKLLCALAGDKMNPNRLRADKWLIRNPNCSKGNFSGRIFPSQHLQYLYPPHQHQWLSSSQPYESKCNSQGSTTSHVHTIILLHCCLVLIQMKNSTEKRVPILSFPHTCTRSTFSK